MWTQYADNHKFEEEMDLDIFTPDFSKDHSNFFMQEDKIKFLFQKNDDFLAEQEYRVLFISESFESRKPFVFNYEDSLSGIIFSDKFDEKNYNTLKKLADLKIFLFSI